MTARPTEHARIVEAAETYLSQALGSEVVNQVADELIWDDVMSGYACRREGDLIARLERPSWTGPLT